MKYVSIAVVLAFIVGLIATAAFADNEPRAPHKVYVCKYVGTPGVDETLQNLIEVDSHALDGDGFAGSFPFAFSDAHSNSIAIGWSGDGYPVLGIGNCTAPVQEELTQVEASVQPLNPTCDDSDGSTIGLILGNEDKVNYSVEGNVAPGETVSVTAKAKEGYEITGLSEFAIEFDSFDSAACQGDGGEGVAGEKGLASVAPVVTSKAPSGGDLPFTL